MATTKKAAAKAPTAKKTGVAKAATKVVQVIAAAAPAPAARPATAPKAKEADKAKKPKLMRDSFTIPKAEYGVLDQLKQRAAKLGRPAKKSEVLRAGVKALASMSDVAFLASLGAVPAVKTGRPAKT